MIASRQSISVATLLVLGGCLLYFYTGGRLGSYLAPSSHLAVLLAGVGLLALAVFNLLNRDHPLPRAVVREGSARDEPGEGCEAFPQPAEETGETAGALSASLAVLIPLLVAMIFSQDRLSSEHGARWGWGGEEGSGTVATTSGDSEAWNLFGGLEGMSLPAGSEGPAPLVAPLAASLGPRGTSRTQAGSGWVFPVPPLLRDAEARKGSRVGREQSYLMPRRAYTLPGASGGGEVSPVLPGPVELYESAAAEEEAGYGPFTLRDLEDMVARNEDGDYLLNIPQIYHSVGDVEVMEVLEGLPVEVTAQLMEETLKEPGAHRLKAFRFSVDCCPTHSRGISIPVDFDGPPPSYSEGGWYRLSGEVRFVPEASGTVPVLRVARVMETVEPVDDMLF